MQTVSYIIIFGAAAKENGEPSGAMKRRVNSALLIAKELANAVFIVTGGVGKGKTIPEALVMKKLLANSGISEEKIISENKATDTLSSVVYCIEILKTQNYDKDVYVCSDTYHIPRCRLLFYLFGMHTKYSQVLGGLNANGLLKWTYYYLREIVAIPFDTLLVYLHKFKNKNIEKSSK